MDQNSKSRSYNWKYVSKLFVQMKMVERKQLIVRFIFWKVQMWYYVNKWKWSKRIEKWKKRKKNSALKPEKQSNLKLN